MNVVYVSREQLDAAVRDKVRDVDVVLDIGPGIRPQTLVKPYVHICVDAHRPYLERLQQEAGDDPRYVLVNAVWDVALGMLPPKSVDTVFAIDVIEHMEKEAGRKMLREAERVARQQVVIFTPLGFFPQSYDDPDEPDRWGMDGAYWQTHRSGWELADFDDGWEIVCCKDFHLVDEHDQPLRVPMGAFWAVRTLGEGSYRRVSRSYNPQANGPIQAQLKGLMRQTLPMPIYKSLRSVWQALRRGTT
jgi:hypothetical protein